MARTTTNNLHNNIRIRLTK